MVSPWPFEVLALGRVAVGGLLWRARGLSRATVIVKATFSMLADGPATITTPAEVRAKDGHLNDNPLLGVVAPSDLSPYLPQADIVLSGHAYAPNGKEVPELLARLGVVRGQQTVLDKAVTVMGDRTVKKDGEAPPPKPFTRMPLTYDRAYGGAGFQDNPLGVGRAADPNGNRRLPNLLYPGGQGPTMVAGFAPISRAWPLRKKLLKPGDKQRLDQPVIDLPDGFELAYFQSAPEDQRATYVQGDEWILLLNMNRDRELYRTRLPQARAFARVTLPGQADQTLALAADTLIIDTDAELITVVWRGSVAAREDRLPAMRVLAGVDLLGAPLVWPAAPPSAQELFAGASSMLAGAPGGTLPIPMEPPTAPPPPSPERKDFAGTIMLDESPLPDAEARMPRENPLEATITLVPQKTQPAPPPVLPFATRPEATPVSAPRASANIPGAPWAGEQAASPPSLRSAFDGTIALDGPPQFEGPLPSRPPGSGPTTSKPESVEELELVEIDEDQDQDEDEDAPTEVPPPRVAPRAPEPAPQLTGNDDVWAPEPKVEPAQPTKPEPAKPNVNDSLYSRFGRK